MNLEIRPLRPEDEAIVWQMLMHAAHEPSLEAVQTQPDLVRYAADWGKQGDMGYVALLNQTPIGATWLRLWLGEKKGYGYVDDAIPELGIAVLPKHRSQGVGTQLLHRLLAEARIVFPGVSLSVRSGNPAVRLYQRFGFVKVEASDIPNRVGGNSFTMVYRFAD